MSQNREKIVADGVDPKLLMEAMMGKMRCLIRQELEEVHERLDRMENSRQESPQYHNRRRERHERGMWRMVRADPREMMNKARWVAIGGMRKIGVFGIGKITTLMA